MPRPAASHREWDEHVVAVARSMGMYDLAASLAAARNVEGLSVADKLSDNVEHLSALVESRAREGKGLGTKAAELQLHQRALERITAGDNVSSTLAHVAQRASEIGIPDLAEGFRSLAI